MKGRYCEMCDFWWAKRITVACPACGALTTKGEIPEDEPASARPVVNTEGCVFDSREGVAVCFAHGPVTHTPKGWRCGVTGLMFPFGTPFGSAALPPVPPISVSTQAYAFTLQTDPPIVALKAAAALPPERPALEPLAAKVLRHLADWDDAETRYHAPGTNTNSTMSWAQNPNSIGAKFVQLQIREAMAGIRSCRGELEAAFSPVLRPSQEPK